MKQRMRRCDILKQLCMQSETLAYVGILSVCIVKAEFFFVTSTLEMTN